MLLNASPNSDGLIPTGDMARYRELGVELERRFAAPLGHASGAGSVHTVRFDAPKQVDQVVFMEDYREGHRVRRYVLEAREPDGTWRTVNEGTSVGRKRIVMFEPLTATQVSLRITESVGEPLIRSMTAHFVGGDNAFLYEPAIRGDVVSEGARATASDVHSARFPASSICDGNPSTRWATGSKWGTPAAMKPPFAAWVELDLGEVKTVGSTAVVEGWDRSRRFRLEYRVDPAQPWQAALTGTTLGARYQRDFSPVAGRYWRLHILESTDEPTIWEWQLFGPREVGAWRRCASVGADAFDDGVAELAVDLRPFITEPGQFLLRIDSRGAARCEVERMTLLYNGREVVDSMLSAIAPGELYNINRTAAVVEGSAITLHVSLRAASPEPARVDVSIQRSF